MERKKTIRIAAIVIAVVVASVALYYVWLINRFKTEVSKMSSLSTGEVTPGIFAIKDEFANVYLVKTADGFIAFDAGKKQPAIEEGMKKLGIAPADVRALFLTHTDGDHVAAVGLFPNAAIYIGANEEQMVNGTKSRAPFMKNKLAVKYATLNDGQVMNVDTIEVRCLHAPGHTPGSMCYVVNGENIFTGDTLSLKKGRVDVFNEFFNMDTETERKTITKIRGLPGVKRIFTAHYGYSPDFTEAFKDWK